MLETVEKLIAVDIGFKTYCGNKDDGSTRKRRRHEKLVGAPDADDCEVARNKAQRETCEKTKDVSSSIQTTSYFDGWDGVYLEGDFARFLEQRGKGVNKTKVEVYLSDGMEKKVEEFQILNSWKLNSIKFPVLFQVAKHVLGMPISSVASKSDFSVGGRVIDATRSSLTETTAEALICTQEWNVPVQLILNLKT
ncbi:unnamed protein product [Lactuca virosa]|uniref:HAT C-terminal dimerisation domain-containing protein n=1 Tax=Lactuca virosa TaxID=75947 RepID=A0AAU9NS69_9ASTR|nr:unnamed protein product [Lactuca virosa]